MKTISDFLRRDIFLCKVSIVPVVLLSLFIFSSCMLTNDNVTGNGRVESSEISVDRFTELILSGQCNFELIQSPAEKVIIEADENLHDYVVIEQRGNVLTVKTRENTNFRNYRKFTITVQLQDIDRLNISTVGNVTSLNPLNFDELDMRISSVGNNTLEIVANSLSMNNSAVGNNTITGSAGFVALRNSSVGNLNMRDFNVSVLEVNSSGVGNVHLFASDELSIRHSGVGNLTYSGNAEVKDFNVSGVGNVSKR